MLKIGSQPIGYTITTDPESLPVNQDKWRIDITHKSGGIKAHYYIGQDNCGISKFDFELTEIVCGSGSITFAYIDMPLHAYDTVEIYYNNVKKYKGFIESTPDPKGGVIKILPFSKRLDELVVNSSFTIQTVSYILQTIIQAVQTDTGITWHPDYVDTGSTDTYTLNYAEYEKPKKIIDELVKKLDDREWGVTAFDIFTVYQPSTTITKTFLYGDDPYYTEVDADIDYGKVKQTRSQVFMKTTGTSETARVGQVGYGSGYDTPAVEVLTRKKVGKFTASEVVGSAAMALDIAYNNLLAQAVTPQSVDVKNFDLTRGYFPAIGDRLKVQDRIARQLRTIIHCDSLTDDDDSMGEAGSWIGMKCTPSISTTSGYYTEGTGALYFSGSLIDTGIIYDFGELIHWYYPEKLLFMLRSDVVGQFMAFSTAKEYGGWSGDTWCGDAWCDSEITSDYLFETTTEFNIPTGGVWKVYSLDITDTDWQYLSFYFKTAPGSTATIYIDQIQLFCYHRQTYEACIVKAKFNISKANDRLCQITLNEYNMDANDVLWAYERQIEKLEAIAANT